VAAATGLDGGLLVRADDVVVRAEGLVVPAAGVEVQDAGRFGPEVRVGDETQDRCCQGLIASWSSQRRTVEADTNAAMPRDMASRASSGHDQRDSGAPVSAGSWRANALTCAACRV